MDDDNGLGIRSWAFYEVNNLGLQLMPSAVDRDTKMLLSNGGFLNRDCGGVSETSIPPQFLSDGWIHHSRDPKVHHMLPMNYNYHVLSDHSLPTNYPLQMLQTLEPFKEEKFTLNDEPGVGDDIPLKKRLNPQKAPKTKKAKKVKPPRDETATNVSKPQRRVRHKNVELVINGVDLDISRIPMPVCSCTGTPQQCYRWGAGGWQSACCTTSISMYPLPMSTKRRGARIAGRKMSRGAFKKVLERLTGEGYNLSSPIDLRALWAKHGTNKFVTIR